MGAPIPQFIDPTLGAAGPTWVELAGRVVAMVPTGLDEHAPDTFSEIPGATKPQFTYDLYVLNGGELIYGSAPKKDRAATHKVATPAKFTGQITQNANIVRSLRKGWNGTMATATILGVIEKSTIGAKGDKPWNVSTIEDGDPRKALAGQVFAAVQTGQYTWPEPVELAAAAAAAGPQVSYAQPQQQQFAPPQQQQQFAAPMAQPAPMAAPAAPAWQPPTPAAPAWTPPAAAPELVNPGNVDPALWATLSDEHKRQAIASYQQFMTQQAAQPANPWQG